MYRPLPKELTIKNSPIEGLGVFTNELLPISRIFDNPPTHFYKEENRRSTLGGFLNHSFSPNCKILDIDDKGYLKTLRDIEPGEELTVDYTITPCGSDYLESIKKFK